MVRAARAPQRQRWARVAACFPLAEHRADLPGCSLLLSTRNRRIYVMHLWQLEDFGLCCTLVPCIAPHIHFSVRSVRVFASGVAVPFGHCHACACPVARKLAALSAPLTGIQLTSATLWHCLPLDRTNSLISQPPFTYVCLVFKTWYVQGAHRQTAGHTRHTTRRMNPIFRRGYS
jgi:hypothetical protein